MAREELDGATHTGGVGFRDINRVATIMFGGGTDVPTVDTVGGPSATLIGCFVKNHLGAEGCERRAVEVEGAVEVCFSGEAGVEAGGP